jgi:hypothetical protein
MQEMMLWFVMYSRAWRMGGIRLFDQFEIPRKSECYNGSE